MKSRIRLRIYLVLAAIFAFSICALTLAASNWKVTIDGKTFSNVKSIDGKAYVPLEAFAAQIGAKVTYDKRTKTYSIRTNTVSSSPIRPQSTLTSASTTPSIDALPVATSPFKTSPTIDPNLATVIRVVDGDTMVVDWNGKEERVRLIGVDTPETVDPDRPVQPFGKEASDYTKLKLSGQTIRLELDVDERDRYGRLLAYVWLNNQLFNADLIRNGYAVLLTIAPNVKYVERFKTDQQEAREAKRGLWATSLETSATTPMPTPAATQIVTPASKPVLPIISTQTTSVPVDRRININTASQAELESIPGIGPTLASRIIEYRLTNAFDTTKEIIEVKGIGDSTYRKIEPFIRIN